MATRKHSKAHRTAAKGSAQTGRRRHAARPQTAADGQTYWLYGTHPVLAALDNTHRRIRRLICTESTASAVAKRPVSPDVVDRQTLSQTLPQGAVHQGLAAEVFPLEPPPLADVLAREAGDAPILILDQVTDPQNVGAILRSAAAFGARALITTDHHAPPESGALAKAAAGALERVPIVRAPNLARAIRQVADNDYWILGLDASGERTLSETKPAGATALVLGAEGRGLRRLSREACDEIVRLPIASDVESLNVSNAAAIALYELTRETHDTT